VAAFPPECERGHENYEDTLTDLTQGPLPHLISIDYSAAACGAGKTFWATRFAASRVGLGNFVFALDRIDEFPARRQMLLDAFTEIGRPPCRIEAIHAQNTSGVTQAIRDFSKDCREPTILFITHAGLQLSDLSAYRDWYLVIDEVPNCWFSDELKTHLQLDPCLGLMVAGHPESDRPDAGPHSGRQPGKPDRRAGGADQGHTIRCFRLGRGLGRHGGGWTSGRWLAVVRCLESRMPAAIQAGVDAGEQH
jgi:hypothetical protein